MARILGDDWLLPALDAKNRAWFTSGALVLQACTRCAAVQFPPEDACRSCGSFELGTRASAGLGRVESVVVVHHAVHPLLKPRVPYAVVLVSLDDAAGVRLIGNVAEPRPARRSRSASACAPSSKSCATRRAARRSAFRSGRRSA